MPTTKLVKPWVGNLRHSKGLCDDWGCIRDNCGQIVIKVNCSWMLEKELYRHRKKGTDPTQPVVDYLLSVLNEPNESIKLDASCLNVSGTEARVCNDIAARQAKGVAKYGTTVEANPLPLRQWLQHAYEEMLDQAVYLRRAIEEMDK